MAIRLVLVTALHLASSPAVARSPSASAGKLRGPGASSEPQGPQIREVTPLNSTDQLPPVAEIRKANKASKCVTIASPLAKSSLLHKVAAIGTTCIFRVAPPDETQHCIDTESMKYGQFGWCWTKLDKSEWGSCSRHCPLAGPPLTLEMQLDKLEKLVDTELAGSSLTQTMANMSVEGPGNEGEKCFLNDHNFCTKGLFCRVGNYACREEDNPQGTCVPEPEVCSLELHEVCGCDGRTYSNPCSAYAAGVNIEKNEPCHK